jgi:carboxypeptidase PM20D1
VRIDIAPGTPAREPTSEAPTDSKEFGLLQQTISARFPDALVTPYLVVGGTDARHYTNVSRNVYRFLPFRMDAEARTRMHGTDERVAIAELVAAVGFYRELIRRSGEAL